MFVLPSGMFQIVRLKHLVGHLPLTISTQLCNAPTVRTFPNIPKYNPPLMIPRDPILEYSLFLDFSQLTVCDCHIPFSLWFYRISSNVPSFPSMPFWNEHGRIRLFRLVAERSTTQRHFLSFRIISIYCIYLSIYLDIYVYTRIFDLFYCALLIHIECSVETLCRMFFVLPCRSLCGR